MHAWRFIRTSPIEAVQEMLRREADNHADLNDGEDDLRMKMLIAACYQDGVFVCEGVDLEASPYKDVRVDLKYDAKQWDDEVETWAAAQKYVVNAAQIEACDLLLERLQDTVDAGDKLPYRLVGPAAVLLERPSCAL